MHNYVECHELRQHNSNTNLSVGNKWTLHSSSWIFDNSGILRPNFEVTYYDFTKVVFYKICIYKMTSFHQHSSKAMAYKPLISFPKQCRRDGGRPGNLSGPGYVASLFVFLGSIINCKLYKWTLSDQTQVTWVNENISRNTVQMIPWDYLVFCKKNLKP